MCIFIGEVLRETWWVIEYVQGLRVANGEQPIIQQVSANFVLNRLSWVFLSAGLTLVIIGWIKQVHRTYPAPSNSFVSLSVSGFAGCMVTIFLFVIVVIVLAFTYCTQVDNAIQNICATVFNACTAYISLMTLFMHLVLLLYLAISFYLINNETEGSENKRFKGTFLKMLVVVLVSTVFYALRSIIFLYRPITQRTFPLWAFYVFGYIAVDTVPPLFWLFVILTSSKKNRKVVASTVGDQYVQLEDLADDDEDDEKPYYDPPPQ